ncbi:sensor histidine kinase, partial [Streptomyces sp. URMC 124]|uniref:sensor histidine kinase n=1 Tax=Streptomyces sp. URMC 124 TaxID=3423405 RepID=UPI003F53280B
MVLYKNAREAITNALRHGGATHVRIFLHYGEDEVRMEVSNNGKVPEPADGPDLGQGKQGIGFSGMLERTKVVGGTLMVQQSAPFTVIT